MSKRKRKEVPLKFKGRSKRESKLVVKDVKPTKLCQFNWKCKNRATVMIAQKEVGRVPNDLYLCETHAKELMHQLMGYHGVTKPRAGLTETLKDEIATKEERINKLQEIIDMALKNKIRNIDWPMCEELLARRHLKWEKKTKNIQEALDMYLNYEYTEDDIARIKVEKAEEDAIKREEENKKKAEEEAKQLVQNSGDLLDSLLETAAIEEGVTMDLEFVDTDQEEDGDE